MGQLRDRSKGGGFRNPAQARRNRRRNGIFFCIYLPGRQMQPLKKIILHRHKHPNIKLAFHIACVFVFCVFLWKSNAISMNEAGHFPVTNSLLAHDAKKGRKKYITGKKRLLVGSQSASLSRSPFALHGGFERQSAI